MVTRAERKGKRAITAIVAVVAFLAVSLATAVLVGLQTRDVMRSQADAYVASLDKISSQIDNVITALQAVPAQACTPSFQKIARQSVFDNYMIKDVMVVNEANRPICSASEGPLGDQPPLPVPKMLAWHNQREIWHELPLTLYDGERTSWATREGDFVVIADMLSDTVVPDSGQWEVRARNPGENGHFHVRGVEGVQQRYMEIQHIPLLGLFGTYQCSTIEFACITRLASPAEVWAAEKSVIIFGLILAAAVAALAHSAAGRWLDRLASAPRRIRRSLQAKTGFYCVYQPIVDMRTGVTTGCEVLARFEDQYGPISPAVFVPMVKEQGQSWAFTEHILTTALSDLDSVITASPDFSISVNFYPDDMTDDRLIVLRSSAVLQEAAARHIRLNCEVLETGFGENGRRMQVCQYLRDCGFTIAIDDFGTGTSNLQQLQDLQPDYVKIDRSFISGRSAGSSGVRTSLIPHIIGIADAAEAEVIAEGVETFAQAQLMRNLGVRLGQGYFYSYPLSLDAFIRYLIEEPQLATASAGSAG